MAVANTTLALPYGKAAFEYALADDSLASWHNVLTAAAQVAADPQVRQLLQNPTFATESVLDIFLAVVAKHANQAQSNFLRLLADNERLPILPEITQVFAQKRAEHERKVTVSVTTFMPLDDSYQQKIAAAMKQRLQRDVTLEVTVDESLLGGAIIRAGDEVIDGSVKGKLAKLQQALAA